MKVYKYNKNMVGIDHEVYIKLKKLKKQNKSKNFSEIINILIDYFILYATEGGENNGK